MSQRPSAEIATALFLLFAIFYADSVLAICTEPQANQFTCDTFAPNPDSDGIQEDANDNNIAVEMLPGSGIDTSDEPGLDENGIIIGDGNLVITLTEASVVGQDDGIQVGGGDLELTIRNSTVLGITDSGIFDNDDGGGQATVLIEHSDIASVESDVLRLRNIANYSVTIQSSRLQVLEAAGSDNAISVFGASGDGALFLDQSTIIGGTSSEMTLRGISLGSGNEQVVIGDGVSILTRRPGGILDEGLVNCGNGSDTLVFAMRVLGSQSRAVSDGLAAAGPDGSVTIGNETYNWQSCETIIDETTTLSSIPVDAPWSIVLLAILSGGLAWRYRPAG